MTKGYYAKMAAGNIRKNPRLYIPRILAEAGLLSCFYIAFSLAVDERIVLLKGGEYVAAFMGIGTVILGILSFILICYINSFLMKRRKSEYGLYHVLGMEKRHVIRILFSESLYTSLFSVVLGIGIGMLFYKLFSLLICKLLQTDVITGFYYINAKTSFLPAIIFICFDLLAFLGNSVSIYRMKPVDLLLEKHTGEKEPKTRWLILGIGTLCMAAGYWLALTAQTSMKALSVFFPAVILVIIGTYFLYISGITFVLKCLKRNKRFYYNKRHMPVVSGLLFRIKKNAIGLASIAILATMILVMISTTVSLYEGMQKALDTSYPQQLYLSVHYKENGNVVSVPTSELKQIIRDVAKRNDVEIRDIEAEHFLSVSYLRRGDALLTRSESEDYWDPDELTHVTFLTVDVFDEITGKIPVSTRPVLDLKDNEIAFCSISSKLDENTIIPKQITIGGKNYQIRNTLYYFPINHLMSNIAVSVGIVVPDQNALDEIYLAQKKGYGEFASEYIDRVAVIFENEAAASEVGSTIKNDIIAAITSLYSDKDGLDGIVDTKWEARTELLGMYGAFLFLGILLGIVCLFSTILIIYYKQISEGYEDRERYQIMQKIGMEEQEVKKTIQSQMVYQFFLPLITAGIHTAVAFPMLLKLLNILMLPDDLLAVVCAMITFAIFATVYVTVYLLTSKTYYNIVH